MSADPNLRVEAQVAVLIERVDHMASTQAGMESRITARLDRIETAVDATNGRVRRLERWRIAVESAAKAVGDALSWRGKVAIGVAIALGGYGGVSLLQALMDAMKGTT